MLTYADAVPARSGRIERRLSLTVLLVLLSVIAHSAAAGSLPALPGLLGATAVAAALSFAVADRRRSARWLFGYLLAAQLLLHLVMAAMGHHAFALLPDSRMLGAHIAAAAVAATLFARSEALVLRWWTAARRMLGAPALTLPRLSVLSSVPAAWQTVPSSSIFELSASGQRGPPIPA